MRNRSAKTGQAVSDEEAQANPETTVKVGKSKDTKRLDWLISTDSDVTRSHIKSRDREWWCITDKQVYASRSARAAIDKAMKAEKVK